MLLKTIIFENEERRKKKKFAFCCREKERQRIEFVSILDIGYLFSLKFVQHGR